MSDRPSREETLTAFAAGEWVDADLWAELYEERWGRFDRRYQSWMEREE